MESSSTQQNRREELSYDNKREIKNFELLFVIMNNSDVAKIAGITFLAGIATGWFLHRIAREVHCHF